jgi:hypothetical protein
MAAKESRYQNSIKNEKGIALIETIPLLFIFLLLLGYGIGFFGVVHTGTLNTIAARTYAFETFRNKANLNYFRDRRHNFEDIGARFHAIASELAVEDRSLDTFTATSRPIAIGVEPSNNARGDIEMHNSRIFEIQDGVRNRGVSTSPVWIMSGYGICLNYGCGD